MGWVMSVKTLGPALTTDQRLWCLASMGFSLVMVETNCCCGLQACAFSKWQGFVVPCLCRWPHFCQQICWKIKRSEPRIQCWRLAGERQFNCQRLQLLERKHNLWHTKLQQRTSMGPFDQHHLYGLLWCLTQTHRSSILNLQTWTTQLKL